MKIFLVLTILFFYSTYSIAQSDSVQQLENNNSIHLSLKKNLASENNLNPDESVNYTRLAVLGGVTLATGIGLHIYQANAWWRDQRRNFHFQNDWEYALWIDKLGHFWAGSGVQHLFSSALEWSNVERKKSILYGAILSSVYMLYIEFEDGFATDWGFSPGDATADVLGSFYPVLQEYVPFMQNINLKYSYYPSKYFQKGAKAGNNLKTVIDDYEGQSFYLSFRVNEFLPQNLERYWPDFLCLALGYNIRNWDGYGKADKNFYLTLDYDLEKIPLEGGFWDFLKKTLNHIHFPAPGIKYTNNKFYLTLTF
ncbi:MAG: YfiM family protein [Bacteroidetes bacterium]|nr:YfiM family protein [Bacteroidota bacterium]